MSILGSAVVSVKRPMRGAGTRGHGDSSSHFAASPFLRVFISSCPISPCPRFASKSNLARGRIVWFVLVSVIRGSSLVFQLKKIHQVTRTKHETPYHRKSTFEAKPRVSVSPCPRVSISLCPASPFPRVRFPSNPRHPSGDFSDALHQISQFDWFRQVSLKAGRHRALPVFIECMSCQCDCRDLRLPRLFAV